MTNPSTPPPPAAAQPFDLDKRAAQYIALRDKIAEIKKRHTEELKPYNEALFKLNTALLGHLMATNAQNAAAKSGTVYRSERVSVTIQDGDAFRQYVLANQRWDLVDWRANKTTVDEQVQAYDKALTDGLPPPNTGGLPPGLKLTREYVAGVQRAS